MNIVYSEDSNTSGTEMNRIAEIDKKYYPYHFSLTTAQVTRGKWFAQHDEVGVKYVSNGYKTLSATKKALYT